jgi:3-phenylpropionate/trans-cinnamate dioxygenase ferredoxin subunit
VGGRFHALRNLCPHQQAPLCEGRIMGTTLASRPGTYVYGREGQILRCPWHGWEFDLTTGRSVFDPDGCRVKQYPVSVEGGGEEARPMYADVYPVTVEGRNVVVHV